MNPTTTRCLCTIALGACLSAPAAAQAPKLDLYGDPLPAGAIARLGSTRFVTGHDTYRIGYSPDGKMIVTFSREDNRIDSPHAVRLLDAATGELIRRYTVPSVGGALSFSPDSKLLAVPDGRDSIALHDTAAGGATRKIRTAGIPTAMAFSPDGMTLAVAHVEFVQLYDVAAGTALARMPGGRGAAFSEDGNQVLSVINGPPGGKVGENAVVICNARDGKEVRRVSLNIEAGQFLKSQPAFFGTKWAAIHSGGQFRGDDVQLRLFNLQTGRMDANAPTGRYGFASVEFSPDGKHLLAVSQHLTLILTVPDFKTLDIPGRVRIRAATFHPDSKIAAVALSNGRVGLLHLESKSLVGAAPDCMRTITGVAISPDGSRVVTGLMRDPAILWDARTDKELRSLGDANTAGAYRLAFSPDGAKVLTGDPSGNLVMSEAATGRRLWAVLKRGEAVLAMHVSPDGRKVVTADMSTEKVFDANSGKLLWDSHAGGPNRLEVPGMMEMGSSAAAICPGDKLVARGGRDLPLTLTSVSLGRFSAMVKDVFAPNWMEFAADGQLLVATTAKEVVVLEVASAGILARWPLKTPLMVPTLFPALPASLAPDSRRLAVATIAGSVTIFDVMTGRPLVTLSCPDEQVSHVRWSPDGRLLVASMREGSTLVCEVPPPGKSPPAARLAPAEIAAAWNALREPDPSKGYSATLALGAGGEEVVEALRGQLKAPAAAPAANVAQWIAELDSPKFAVREAAFKQLQKLGPQSEPALRAALEQTKSAETRERLTAVLAKWQNTAGDLPDVLRALRAIAALEHIGSPAAVKIIEGLAVPESGSRVCDAAEAALLRLKAREKPSAP